MWPRYLAAWRKKAHLHGPAYVQLHKSVKDTVEVFEVFLKCPLQNYDVVHYTQDIETTVAQLRSDLSVFEMLPGHWGDQTAWLQIETSLRYLPVATQQIQRANHGVPDKV